MNIHTSDFNSKYVVLKTGVQCDITGMHMKKKMPHSTTSTDFETQTEGGGVYYEYQV